MAEIRLRFLERWQHLRVHLLVVAFFYGLTVAFFYPVFLKDKSISQGDIKQYRGSVYAINQSARAEKEEVLWNPNLFSGMPTYFVGLSWRNPILGHLHQLSVLYLPHPVWVFFACLLWSYVMLLCFRVRPLVAVMGALIFVCSSYFFIGIGAGHNARIGAMAYMPMICSGIMMGYSKQWRWGLGLCALGVAFQLASNHLQITYYTLFVVLFFVLQKGFQSYREGQMNHFLRASLLLLVAALLGFATYFGQFLALYDYSRYSIRGERVLEPREGEAREGLDKDYAFQYSNEPMESMTLLVPNFYGGRSYEQLGADSYIGAALRQRGQAPQSQYMMPTYWGAQPITSPYYMGAITFFLLLMAAFLLPARQKYWLLALGCFAVALTWGKHFAWFNDLLFDYLPGYNKFRSHTFATLIIVLVGAVMAALALERGLREGFSEKWRRAFWIATGGSLGLLLLIQLLAGLGSYTAPVDEQLSAQGAPDWYLEALRADRLALLRADTWRSFFFIALAAALLYLSARRILGQVWGVLLLLGVLFWDLAQVSTRYFNPTDSFEMRTSSSQPYEARASDLRISSDTSAHYRVFPMENPFNNNRSSTHHRSVGGYHPAKLRRYQDLIEYGLSEERAHLIKGARSGSVPWEQMPVAHMLNVKYFIFGPESRSLLQNPRPCGAAWFVERLLVAETPDQEIEYLQSIDPCRVATWDASVAAPPDTLFDARGSAQLQHYSPNRIQYEVETHGRALFVMSEIYYPDWKAYVDGLEQPIRRVNYALRAIELSPGRHKIRLEMSPERYHLAKHWSWSSNIILLLGLCYLLGYTLYPICCFRREIEEK